MKKPLSVWAVYTHLLASWMSGLKKKAYLMIRNSKKDRLSSITSAPIYVLHSLLLLIMMSYLKIVLQLPIKIENKSSTQIKQILKLKQMFVSVLLKKFTTVYKVQKKIPRVNGQVLNIISQEALSSTQ